METPIWQAEKCPFNGGLRKTIYKSGIIHCQVRFLEGNSMQTGGSFLDGADFGGHCMVFGRNGRAATFSYLRGPLQAWLNPQAKCIKNHWIWWGCQSSSSWASNYKYSNPFSYFWLSLRRAFHDGPTNKPSSLKASNWASGENLTMGPLGSGW